MMTDKDLSEYAEQARQAMQRAGEKTIERKRRLGQYWVVWDGEKPVKIYPENSVPENSVDVAAE